MARKPLVWVHGAGPQAPPAAFKHEADTIVFGRTRQLEAQRHPLAKD